MQKRTYDRGGLVKPELLVNHLKSQVPKMNLSALLPPLPKLPRVSLGKYVPFVDQARVIKQQYDRGAESVVAWAMGGQDQIFGPLEQVVAAAVIIGLALQYSPSSPNVAPIPPSIQIRPSPAATNEQGNSTSPNDLSGAAVLDPPSSQTSPMMVEGGGQAWVDLALAFAARDWRAVLGALQDMSSFNTGSVDIMSLAMIGMMGAIAWLLIPLTFKARCRRAYQTFTQDPSAMPTPTTATDASSSRNLGPEQKLRASSDSRVSPDAHSGHQSRSMDRPSRSQADLPAKSSESPDVGSSRRSDKDPDRDEARRDPRASDARSSREKSNSSSEQDPDKKRERPADAKFGGDDRPRREKDVGRDGSREKQPDPREMTEEQVAKERGRRKAAGMAAKEAEPSSSSSKPSSEDRAEGSRVKPREKAKDVPEASRRSRESSERPESSRKSGDAGGKTQSERAREARARERSSGDRNESKAGERDAHDKGKGRAAGERSSSSSGSSSSASSKPSKDDSGESHSSRPSLSRTSSDDSADSEDSRGAVGAEDDPLMAGDYRPLKSILKKPGQSKKGKKKRNKPTEHHNHFLTMRGWRPALVPFPHGLHPPPGEPRGTMWWNNIPRDARHLMVQKPAKEPEKDDEASDASADQEEKKDEKPKETKKPDPEKGSRDAKDPKSKDATVGPGDKKKSESERARERKERGDKPPSGSPSGDKASGDKDKGRDEERDKQKEMEKLMKAKQEAKAKEEAVAKEKARTRAQAEAAERPSSSSSVSPPKSILPVIDPQLQKATFVAQGVLCMLLYHLAPDMGLLLLGFFAWQFIREKQRQEEAFVPTALGAPSQTHTPKSQHSERATREASRSATVPEKDEGSERAKERSKSEMTPEMIERMKKVRAEREAARGGSRAEDANAATAERGAKSSDGHSSRPESKDIPPEVLEKMKRAQAAKEAQKGGSETGRSRELSKSDMTPEMIERIKRARAARDAQTESESGRTRELSKADMTPEMLEQLRKARGPRSGAESPRRPERSGPEDPQANRPSSRPASNDNRSRRDGGSEKPPRLRPQDMTPEQREKYMEEYKRMKEQKKREAERAAKERRGEGSSGLSFEEKESLSMEFPS